MVFACALKSTTMALIENSKIVHLRCAHGKQCTRGQIGMNFTNFTVYRLNEK